MVSHSLEQDRRAAICDAHVRSFREWMREANGIVAANYSDLPRQQRATLEVEIAKCLMQQASLERIEIMINDLKLSDWREEA